MKPCNDCGGYHLDVAGNQTNVHPTLEREAPSIRFDIDANYSLTELAQGLDTISIRRGVYYLRPNGPGGGNTEVSFYGLSVKEAQAVKKWMKKEKIR